MRHDRAYWVEYRTQRTITMAPRFVFNFHGIGNPPPQIPTDERPFWLGEQQFKSVIDNIVRSNLASKIEITFDDGNSSDFDIALPRLQSAGLFAGFYVLAGRISKPGYLSAEQIHILTDSKMEIGLHGMDHLDWTRQDDDTMRREITEARRLVELAARKPVVSSALPFGRYNWRVMRRLRQEGFERIYTSDGAARMFTGPVRSRFSLRNNMRLENLIDIVEHHKPSRPSQSGITLPCEVEYFTVKMTVWHVRARANGSIT